MRYTLFIIILLFSFTTSYSNKRNTSNNCEPLFGKQLSYYKVTSTTLKGASFYLVSGHGGPDPGAIGKYNGKELHEDEYAYDIILRLGRELLMRGAKVEIIIQDKNDGIRNDYVLKNNKTETCYGDKIPLNQIERLNQRCNKINQLSRKDRNKYKRAIFIHVDSRGKGQQTDVFFYHAIGSNKGKRLADNLHKTFNGKYGKYQPNRGFTGTVSERSLQVLRNTNIYAAFLELGNISNPLDQKRLVIPANRQALARWIADGIEKDYKDEKR